MIAFSSNNSFLYTFDLLDVTVQLSCKDARFLWDNVDVYGGCGRLSLSLNIWKKQKRVLLFGGTFSRPAPEEGVTVATSHLILVCVFL